MDQLMIDHSQILTTLKHLQNIALNEEFVKISSPQKNNLNKRNFMKKYLIITLSIITIHAHAMETESSTHAIIPIYLKPRHIDILDHIAQYLPFHDCEFEEEFVERTKALKTLTVKEIPQEYVVQLPFTNIKCGAYSPNNAIIAVLQKHHTNKEGRACMIRGPKPQLIIIHRKDNLQQEHRIGKFGTKSSHLAVSPGGNLVATIHSELDTDASRRHEVLNYKKVLTITNLSTKAQESCDVHENFTIAHNHPIAFNKQGTHLIIHGTDYSQPGVYIKDSLIMHHKIIPVTINTPDPQVDYSKTFAKYCAQRGICKKLIAPITEKK